MIKRFKNWLAERRFRKHVKIAKKCETNIFYQHKLELNNYWDALPFEYVNHVKYVALAELNEEMKAEIKEMAKQMNYDNI